MTKPTLTVMVLLCLVLGALAPARADEEFKSDADRLVVIRRSLDKVHANPAAKSEVIAYAREKMKGVPDLDQRLVSIGRILDSAAALNPQQYKEKKEILAQKMLAVVHPPEKPGQPGKAP